MTDAVSAADRAPGWLHVSIDAPSDLRAGAGLPVDVRRLDLSLVASTVSGGSLALEPGRYVVLTEMPDGRSASTVVEVEAETSITAHLALPESPAETVALPSPEPETALGLDTPTLQDRVSAWVWDLSLDALDQLRDVLDRLNLDQITLRGSGGTRRRIELPRIERSQKKPPRSRGSQAESAAERPVFVAATTANLLEQFVAQMDAIDDWVTDDGAGWTIRSPYLHEPSPCMLQVLVAGEPGWNVALPPGAEVQIGRPSPSGGLVRGIRFDNPEADLLLAYRKHGRWRQAKETARHLDAEELLRQKMMDPIGATIGAYALLRMSSLSRLHDWTRNLMNWFPALPDGLAIRGEHLARLGDHAEAVQCFLELPGRGLPFFTDGLMLLVQRLRLYEETGAFPEHTNAIADLLDRLLPYFHLVDPEFPVLRFPGLLVSDPGEEVLTADSATLLMQGGPNEVTRLS